METLSFILAKDEELVSVISSIARIIWTEYYVPIIGEPQVAYMLGRFQSENAIKQQCAEGYRYYILRNQSGAPVGYFSIQLRGELVFLSKLYVSLISRGNGIGRQAMAYIENLAREAGGLRIQLTVNKKNCAAINVYKRWGFCIVNSVTVDIGGGFVMDDYVMEKVLSV